MKKLLIMALLALGARAAEPRPALLMFDYPQADLTNLTFVVYASDALPPSWLPVTNFNLTHPSLIVGHLDATNKANEATLSFPLAVERGQRFYAMTASNAWWESDFSNAVGIPGVPPSGSNLRLVPVNRPQAARQLTPAQRREAIERANRNQPPIPR